MSVLTVTPVIPMLSVQTLKGVLHVPVELDMLEMDSVVVRTRKCVHSKNGCPLL